MLMSTKKFLNFFKILTFTSPTPEQEGFSSNLIASSTLQQLQKSLWPLQILPSGYRVSMVRNTNIDQIETTPLWSHLLLYMCCTVQLSAALATL